VSSNVHLGRTAGVLGIRLLILCSWRRVRRWVGRSGSLLSPHLVVIVVVVVVEVDEVVIVVFVVTWIAMNTPALVCVVSGAGWAAAPAG